MRILTVTFTHADGRVAQARHEAEFPPERSMADWTGETEGLPGFILNHPTTQAGLAGMLEQLARERGGSVAVSAEGTWTFAD